MNSVILVGGFSETIELVEECEKEIFGIIDNINKNFDKYRYLGTDSDVIKNSEKFKEIPLLISPDLPNIREKLHELYKENGFIFSDLISDKSFISPTAKIGKGVMIQRGVNISANANLGDFVKLNINSNVMHDSSIGNYTSIAPNAVILGNVKVGKNCYIGANATLLPNIEICDNTILGAGAVITKNIYKSGTYIGVPAKKMD